MNILYIHQHFATLDSASGIRSFVFTKHLVESGHNVTLITSDRYLPEQYRNQSRFKINGVSIINIKSGYTLQLNFYRRLLSFFTFMAAATYHSLKIPTDVVFATSTPLTVAFPALVLKWVKKIPFIFEVRDLWPSVPIELGIIKNPLLIMATRLFEKTAYQYADRIICISDGIQQEISATEEKTISIPTGCDLNFFDGRKVRRWKQEVGIEKDFLFVLTGAIGEANAPQYLVEAAKILKEKRAENIAIAVIGDGSAKAKIEQLVHSYALENIFLFPAVKKTVIPEILSAADGGIILHGLSPTYRVTAMPNKFFDYIASGLPIIFNFEGPLKNLLLSEGVGYYVNHLYPEELSSVLMYLAAHPEECRAAGKKARDLAEKQFNIHDSAKKLESVLAECFQNFQNQRIAKM